MVVVAVTGANGFVGAHIVGALLGAGHSVRAVVRDPNDPAKTAHLQALAGTNSSKLALVSGDLMIEGSYDEAFRGAEVVIHSAAVIDVLDTANAAEKVLKPAVAGSENVLASVGRVGSVRRLIYISSVAAVQRAYGDEESHTYTEEDWNTWSTLQSDAYGYAKMTAERMLWDRIGQHPSCDLVSLCPAVVLGPCLTKAHTKTSCALVRECLYHNPMNSYYASFVDVRDVAAAALAALDSEEAAGKRFIVVSNEAPMLTTELGTYAAGELPQYSIKAIPKYSEWLLWLLARVGIVTSFQEAMATRRFRFSNSQLKAVLKVQPRSLSTTVKDTASSMIDNGWVKPKLKA